MNRQEVLNKLVSAIVQLLEAAKTAAESGDVDVIAEAANIAFEEACKKIVPNARCEDAADAVEAVRDFGHRTNVGVALATLVNIPLIPLLERLESSTKDPRIRLGYILALLLNSEANVRYLLRKLIADINKLKAAGHYEQAKPYVQLAQDLAYVKFVIKKLGDELSEIIAAITP